MTDPDQIHQLRQRLRARHNELADTPPGNKRSGLLTETVQIAANLINAERDLATATNEQHRQIRARTITNWSWVTTAGLALAALAALPGWIDRGWLVLLLPTLAAVVVIGQVEQVAPQQGQQRRLAATVSLAACAAGLVLIAAARWPAAWVLPVLGGFVTALGIWSTAGGIDTNEHPMADPERES
jgi:1,4-dihydroxy-2-naphthoate octaprenyltransferase